MKKIITNPISVPEETVADSKALQVFLRPELDSRPMARMWFPDAKAGELEADCILEQFLSMAEGGIGGVEVTLLGDDTGNLNARDYGWGTPNWVKTMKKVLKAAKQIPGGFKVDFTITAHWPPIVNTIDPNDPAASSNMVFTWKKLRPEDLTVELPLPETGLYDSGHNPFIFRDALCGVILATVADVPLPELKPMGFPPMDQSGLHHFGPEKTMFDGKIMEGPDGPPPVMEGPKHKVPFVLELSSLENITARTSEMPGRGWRCGVPDKAALEKWYHGEVTEDQIADIFGPEPDGTDMLPDGKRDVNLNRKRMADFQPVWQLNAAGLTDAGSAGEDIQPGDQVIICCYIRGTGQIFSGGFKTRLMKNMTYAANYFTEAGTRAVTDYWDTYILSDPELRSLMEENAARVGGAIFEDSIELHSNGANWSADFEADIAARMGCDPVKYMPVYLGLYFDNEKNAARILEEYHRAEGGMYQDNHVEYINRWAAGFGYSYRAQAGMMGINTIAANTATGITEGDNGTFKDANRRLAGGTHMMNQKYHSFESNTFTGFPFPWSLLVQECHYDASTGTNRIIFHGTAYCKNGSDFYDWWPGWNWGGGGGKAYDFMAWDKRVCWWDDAHVMTDYLSRLCGILQNAVTKVDLAVLHGNGEAMMNGTPCYQSLADRGYSYNILGDYSLTLPTAEVTGGRLHEKGPGYRALLVKDMEAMSLPTAEKLLEFAAAGLPVIFDGGVPVRVFGMEKPEADDAALNTLLEKLAALPGVFVCKGEAEVLPLLETLNLHPAAQYEQHLLEATHLTDDAGDYYAFYNDTLETVSVPVTLDGSGSLIRLNCWSGQAEPAEICDNTFTLELAPQDMKFYARIHTPEAAFTAVSAADAVLPEKYDLQLESFGPALHGDPEYNPACPIESHRETVEFRDIPMGTVWSGLPVSAEDLIRLRVGTMEDVSGRSRYTVEVDLPEGTAAVQVTVRHNERDFLTGGSINGTVIPPVSCMEDTFTVTEGVRAGKNILTLNLDSILTNRLNYETPGFLEGKDMSLLSFGGGKRDYSLRWRTGIERITVVPLLPV